MVWSAALPTTLNGPTIDGWKFQRHLLRWSLWVHNRAETWESRCDHESWFSGCGSWDIEIGMQLHRTISSCEYNRGMAIFSSLERWRKTTVGPKKIFVDQLLWLGCFDIIFLYFIREHVQSSFHNHCPGGLACLSLSYTCSNDGDDSFAKPHYSWEDLYLRYACKWALLDGMHAYKQCPI